MIHTLDVTETPILRADAYYQCANVVWLDLVSLLIPLHYQQ